MISDSLSALSHRLRFARRALLTFAALFAFATVDAQGPPRAVPPTQAQSSDESLKVYLMTMGQGTRVWELFGHNAIWVHDPRLPFDVVYNWGVFDLRTPGFLVKFMLGDMRYAMAADTYDNTVATYQATNRPLWAQELNLTGPEKRALIDFMRWNALPENSSYRYDYYLDNCSTRVRDAIDRVTGGAVRKYLKSVPTEETYRSHSLRMMQGDKLLMTGVDLSLGRSTDTKLSADQASFLPTQLRQYIQGVTLDGGTRKLMGEEIVLVPLTADPEPTGPPRLWPIFLVIGVVLSQIVMALALRDGKWRRRALATVVAIFSGLLGIIGVVFTLLVTITDHVAAHANENMFLVNPLWLAVAVLAPLWILRGRAERWVRWAGIAAIAVALGSILIHVIGLSRQPNWEIIFLLLPVELTMAWVAVRRRSAA